MNPNPTPAEWDLANELPGRIEKMYANARKHLNRERVRAYQDIAAMARRESAAEDSFSLDQFADWLDAEAAKLEKETTT